MNKPKFSLALGKIPGVVVNKPAKNDDGDDEDEIVTGTGAVGVTPSNNVRDRYKKITDLGDAVSELSQSPLHTGKNFRGRAAAGIPTPLGSEMSRAKFDFSGYDKNAHKKKATSPPRKVIKKEDDDMEVFMSEASQKPEVLNLEVRNEELAQQARQKVVNDIYTSSPTKDVMDQSKFKTNIKEEAIDAIDAYKFFNQQELMAVQNEDVLDLQVGGQAGEGAQGLQMFDTLTLPQIRLERLALELNQLEDELLELEKNDIPGGFSDENDAKCHIKEVDYLRTEMQKILGSEAFTSLEGKSKIEKLLEQGTQASIANALNELIERKISEYSSLNDESQETSFKIGDLIELNFQPSTPDVASGKSDKDIISKFQVVDSALDNCERQVGFWQPNYKFVTIYAHLDELCDKVEGLDSTIMNNIGNRAKELNKDLEDILRALQKMNDVNYDKNKVDYLFEMLEKSMESDA